MYESSQETSITFVGRIDELTKIYESLERQSVKVIQLHGQHGIGKTALSHQIVNNTISTLPGRFVKIVIDSCWQETWASIVTRIVKNLIGRQALQSATVEMLEQAIMNAAQQNEFLLVLDNIEQHQMDDAQRFSKLWLKSEHNSVLLMTGVEPMKLTDRRAIRYQISGLSESVFIELFGNVLRARFGDELLLQQGAILAGVPLDILYVRWLAPESATELQEIVARIRSGNFDPTLSVETVLSEITRSPTHFMALGITNQLEFDEGLLGFFWDRLCSGTVQAYAGHRESLVSRQLLMPIPETGGSRFRINEQVHKHLRRALERRIGGVHRLPIIHYFASEYYRRELDRGQPTPEALGAFVNHSLASGEHQRAFRYLFDQGRLTTAQPKVARLEAFHDAFFELRDSTALQFREILQLFLTEGVQNSLSALQRIRVLIELAHISSDLAEFDACIELTTELCDLLEGQDSELVNGLELWRRVWYYRGVSFYNVGKASECIHSYFRIVENSASDDILGILSLGYLAHSLAFFDLANADKYGARAVMLARASGNAPLLAKNLTSHAETLIYRRKYVQADSQFAEAALICEERLSRSTEIRELGRIMGSWAMLFLSRRQFDTAVEKAEEGMRLSRSMGDRRRVACARQYRAIALRHLGEISESYSEMKNSILMLPTTNARYNIPPLLTLARWHRTNFSGLLEDLLPGDIPEDLDEYVKYDVKNPALEVYVKFWREIYWSHFVCGTDD